VADFGGGSADNQRLFFARLTAPPTLLARSDRIIWPNDRCWPILCSGDGVRGRRADLSDLFDGSTRFRLAAVGGFTQVGFGEMIGVPAGTIRHWEHGNRRPNSAASTLLRLLDSDPDIIRALLQKSERQRWNAEAAHKQPWRPPAGWVGFTL
jgi:hypothetical protein